MELIRYIIYSRASDRRLGSVLAESEHGAREKFYELDRNWPPSKTSAERDDA